RGEVDLRKRRLIDESQKMYSVVGCSNGLELRALVAVAHKQQACVGWRDLKKCFCERDRLLLFDPLACKQDQWRVRRRSACFSNLARLRCEPGSIRIEPGGCHRMGARKDPVWCDAALAQIGGVGRAR